MILEKNNLTVQEWNKFYIELLNSLICTPKIAIMFDHSRLSLENKYTYSCIVRVGVRYVITKFSRMDSLPNFLTHGAPLRCESRDIYSGIELELAWIKVSTNVCGFTFGSISLRLISKRITEILTQKRQYNAKYLSRFNEKNSFTK